NVTDRKHEAVLEYCEREGIGFIPWSPLSAGRLATSPSVLARIAQAHDATPSQIGLARLLRRSPVVIPIPGTSRVDHLEENVAAAGIELSESEYTALSAMA